MPFNGGAGEGSALGLRGANLSCRGGKDLTVDMVRWNARMESA